MPRFLGRAVVDCFAGLVVVMIVVWALTRGGAAPQRPRPDHAFRRCPGCAAATEPDDTQCVRCGLMLDSRLAHELGRLRVAEHEVKTLAETGDLDPDVVKAVVAQLERRRRLLQGFPDEPAKPASPSALPEEPAPLPLPAAEPEPIPVAAVAAVDAEVIPAELAPAAPAMPTEASAAPSEPSEPPRRGSVFATFMEERNILWGELVGGLLIVGCSIALLVTLWHRLEAFPYFPFALSAGITLALYGAGQYTLHHWRLTATSLGLLVISLLLAPLDLLLLSDPITRGEESLPVELGVKLAAVLLFAWVVRGAGRDVLTSRTEWRWWLALAVVGPPATQLLPEVWFAGSALVWAWAALACFAMPCLVAVRRVNAAEEVDRGTGAALLQFVGLTVFALAVAFGLHIARSPDVSVRVIGLAFPLTLAGAVVVEVGLAVALRVKDSGPRVAGTAVALAGVLAMTGGLAAGWQQPLSVLLMSAFIGVFFTRIAFVVRIPAAIGASVAAFALTGVVGYHGIAGNWNQPLGQLLHTPDSGAVLAGLALVFAVLSEVLARRAFRIEPVSYALGAAGVGLAGLFVVSMNGLHHPLTAALTHAACAVGLLASNVRWRLRVLAHGGLWVLFIGSLWALHAGYPNHLEKWAFVVSVEAFTFAILGIGIPHHRRGAPALLRRAGRDLAIAAALLAPVLAVYAKPFPDTGWDTATLFALSFTAIALTRLTGAAVATYIGAIASWLGLIHLAAVTTEWEPLRRALLMATLTHATIATIAAVALRRLERVFARPLRNLAVFSSLAGAIVLFVPPVGHVLEWATCAVWLGLVWLTRALVWRERSAFSVFQTAFSLAAVLCGVAWINAMHGPPALPVGYFQPAALHVYAVTLGFLGIAWIVARRLLRDNATTRTLWIDHTWTDERFILAIVVIGQFALALIAIIPEVQAELTRIGWTFYRVHPPALAQMFEPNVWPMFAVLVSTVLASWRFTGTTRDTNPHIIGLLLLFLAVPVVWAGTFAEQLASASALRWGLGAAFLVGTVIVSLRVPLRRALEKLDFPLHPTGFTRPAALFLLAVAAGVVVYLSVLVAEIGLTGYKPSGPTAESVFAQMGTVASNLVPLSLVVLGLACSAGRERSPGYAFAGGLVFTATVAAGYALGVVTGGGRIDKVQLMRIWLLACSAISLWGMAWLATETRVGGGLLLRIQTRLGLGLLAIGAALAALMLVNQPRLSVDAGLAELGQFGWPVLLLAAGVAVEQAVRNERGLKLHALALSALIAGVLAACAVHPWDARGDWLSAHVLQLAWAAVGIGLVIATRKRGESSYWLDGMAVVLALLAMLDDRRDPWGPWLPAGLAVIASVMVGTSAVLNRSDVRVVVSGLLVNLAAILLWLPTHPHTTSGFLLANAAAFAIAAIVWTRITDRAPNDRWRMFADIARGVALVLLWVGAFPTLAGHHHEPKLLRQIACFSVIFATLTAAIDRGAFVARFGLFASVALGPLVTGSQLPIPVWDFAFTPFGLAWYSVVVAVFALFFVRWFIPRSSGTWNSGGWLVIAQAVLALVVIGLGLRLGLTLPELGERIFASPVAMLLLLAAAVILLRAIPTWATPIRFGVVALGVLVVATTAWAVPDPAGSHPWLHRNAWLFVTLAVVGVLGSELSPKLGANWRWAVRNIGGVCAALAVGALCVHLVQQVSVFDPNTKHTPLDVPAVFAMLVGIFGLIVLSIRFALKQELDPLALPAARRTLYVYLAEVLVVLLFTQIRFNVPELFLPDAVKFWTFAVMVIAFIVVGLAELFERRKLDVLATPLRRTGVLLPLIPLLAFWAKPPAFLLRFTVERAPGLTPFLAYLEKLPQHFDTYAWLWFLASGLYGLIALRRNSFGWALLAALATNAALWSLLTHHEVPFFVHPQAWVIPLALIVLVSEHVNRSKLRPEVSNGMRYLGVGMIYVASSSDMFIAGVGQSVWLPVILAVFCVLGVLSGILMRVRAFVFLGVGFLMLDIFAMIWHAAVDLQQTWVWYASGIVLGVAILTLFAFFEKRRGHTG